MSNPAVSVLSQLGVESSPGVGVAANRRSDTFTISKPHPMLNVEGRTPQGHNVESMQQLTIDYTEADISGWVSYTGDAYLLSSVFSKPTPSSIGVASSKKWVFDPAGIGVDTPQTYTLENGNAIRAGKVTHFVVTDYGWKWERTKAPSLSGKGLAQQWVDGITLTASPTLISPTPLMAGDPNFYFDTTSAGLGGTQFTNVYAAEFNIKGKYVPRWPGDRSLLSFPGVVQVKYVAELKVKMAYDVSFATWLADMRAAGQVANKYARVMFQGAIMPGESSFNYLYQLDLSSKAVDVAALEDSAGIYAYELTYRASYDATWGHLLQLTLQNQLASL
jgi:hypothetical protein